MSLAFLDSAVLMNRKPIRKYRKIFANLSFLSHAFSSSMCVSSVFKAGFPFFEGSLKVHQRFLFTQPKQNTASSLGTASMLSLL